VFITMTSTGVTLAKPGSGEGRIEPIYVGVNEGYDKELLLVPSHYRDSIERVMIPNGLIRDRVEKLAHDIRKHYGEEPVHVLCILKGSRAFFDKLLTFFNRLHSYGDHKNPPYFEHYVRLKSYANDASTGQLQLLSEDLSALAGQNVLIVEDIVDTGTTLTKFCTWLSANVKPKSIGVASLLEKRTDKTNGFKADFVGFSVPDEFVVGFSLDYNEIFRDLEHICIVNKFGCAKYRASTVSNPAISMTL